MDAFSFLSSIFVYVGVAYGLMCIGRTCGLKNPWLSWIPFANIYQLGVVADHYMARNENRKTKQRTTLLVLHIIMSAASVVCISIMFVGLFDFFNNADIDFWRLILDTEGYEAELEALLIEYFSGMTDDMVMRELGGLLATVLLPLLALLPVSIAYLIFYYIALHRIYKLMDPRNSTVYTVLSVLFDIAAPIIFLIIAKKTPVYPAEGPFFEAAPAIGSADNGTDGGADDGSGPYTI